MNWIEFKQKIPYLSHLLHFSQIKFTNFDLQFYLAPPLPHHICLQLSNLLSYPFSILQPLLKSPHSYSVLLTLLVILIQSLPHSSNNANLFFFSQSQISSTYLCPLESFLINSKTVLYILFSKNPTLTKKTYPTTGQYLTYLTYQNLQNDLWKPDLLTISMKTTSWTLSSLPTPNSILLKLLYLIAVHDHIIRAMSQQQVTGLCLLDLSAAFDTMTIPFFYIDSNLGLDSLKLYVLSWIHSYLSSRSFSVDINGIKSPPSQLLYGVPQGSVLGPLLFILYTTPLRTIISRSSVNHKLYADDTQLFLSFSADAFSEKIQPLQDTIFEISTWMASNFLSLNPTKTEFLLIGLPAQLAKIHNGVIHILRHHRGGLPHWWRLMTRGRGVVDHDDVIKKSLKDSIDSTLEYLRNQEFYIIIKAVTSVIILICIYYCIIHGFFNSMLSVGRHSLIYLIDISDFTTIRGASRNREIKISIFTDDVILGGGGLGADDVWWRGGGGLKMVRKLMT